MQDLLAKTKYKEPFVVNVRYLYQPGELEGGQKREIDLTPSSNVYRIEGIFTKPKPVTYHLRHGPRWSFVREELLVIPPKTVLPPI